jgi:uridine kinase
VFINRDRQWEYWTVSMFLDAARQVSVARMAARDQVPVDSRDPRVARYVGAQRINLASCNPARRTSPVIDNTD